LKINRITCPEVAVNGKFYLENWEKIKLSEKIEICQTFAWKN